MTDYERGYRAGIEAAAKEADKRLAGTSVSEYDAGWMRASFLIATSIRALSQPREPTPSTAALDWPNRPFRFYDDPGEHDPCYVVTPGGEMLPFNHHATPGVDVARARWIVDACNAALAASPAFPLCPEHAIRLPCPACATREDG